MNYLKKYSLSLNASIELFSADSAKNSKIYFDKKSFNNCEIQNIKSKKIYISPSGEVTEFSLDCLIKNELVKIKINSSGRPILMRIKNLKGFTLLEVFVSLTFITIVSSSIYLMASYLISSTESISNNYLSKLSYISYLERLKIYDEY